MNRFAGTGKEEMSINAIMLSANPLNLVGGGRIGYLPPSEILSVTIATRSTDRIGAENGADESFT